MRENKNFQILSHWYAIPKVIPPRKRQFADHSAELKTLLSPQKIGQFNLQRKMSKQNGNDGQ